MRINGHALREHFRLFAPLFILIAAVWALRLILSAAGSPEWLTRMVSVTAATSAAVLLAALVVHVRRFGSYANVVVASLLLNAWAEILITLAILVSVLTGTVNVYSAPEYSFPSNDPHHLRHMYAHLTFGVGVGALVGSGVGCLMLWLLRRISPPTEVRG